MTHPTAVEAELARRRRAPLRWLLGLGATALVLGVLLALVLAAQLLGWGTPFYRDDARHFRYGSIGAEVPSGIPARVWHALPVLYPGEFEGRRDYRAFGFLYDDDRPATPQLPIGVAERERLGIDLVWFNCALCHVGTIRETADAEPVIIDGMPSNNLDLGRFTSFLLEIADDPRMEPEPLFDAMREAGVGLGPVDRLFWRLAIFPQLRAGMIRQASLLQPLLDLQPEWGRGRVDTFNPYKVLHFGIEAGDLADAEVIGASDFPSVFLQRPRDGMWLHWDGNNDRLAERNLSAALGAGVTPESVDHRSVQRVAEWLNDLVPPRSPHRPDPEAVARGRPLYMEHCASCHGYQGGDGYVFSGEKLGTVEPIEAIGTDPARLDSYTESFSERQKAELFSGTPYAFRSFRKTDGYANAPLDGLWMRGPYLHNGSVPTLADLLDPPDARPTRFLRNSDVIDPRGGFVSQACEPQIDGCFDTELPGNSNTGHLYGTALSMSEKADLLAYLLTF